MKIHLNYLNGSVWRIGTIFYFHYFFSFCIFSFFFIWYNNEITLSLFRYYFLGNNQQRILINQYLINRYPLIIFKHLFLVNYLVYFFNFLLWYCQFIMLYKRYLSSIIIIIMPFFHSFYKQLATFYDPFLKHFLWGVKQLQAVFPIIMNLFRPYPMFCVFECETKQCFYVYLPFF